MTLEAINAFATTLYLNYLFFYLQKQFGFGNLGNLVFSALNGFVYIFCSLYAGRFAQQHGYFLALQMGFIGMGGALMAGLFLPSVGGQLAVLLAWTLAICFTWPVLEALASEGRDLQGLPRMVGIYNMIWAMGGALAFFSGGALMGLLGWKSLFWLPAILHGVQSVLALWLAKSYRAPPGPVNSPPPPWSWQARWPGEAGGRRGLLPGPASQCFQRMAWVANPLAYVAINTAIPLMPDVARRLELSPMLAGFVCSAWMFARLGAFALLWRWTAWHYRFGWLVSSYVLLILSFAGLLLAPYLWAVVAAEILFGWSIGLIYYSSLFYSMDASEFKSVYGGVHEAAIGLGICTGPALGATALRIFPQQPHASAWAVTCLLIAGMALLVALRRRGGVE